MNNFIQHLQPELAKLKILLIELFEKKSIENSSGFPYSTTVSSEFIACLSTLQNCRMRYGMRKKKQAFANVQEAIY